MNLFEHSANCTPLLPCPACDVVAWLRSKLSADDFSELVKRANGVEIVPKPKRSYRRRRPTETMQPQEPAAVTGK